MKQIFHIGHSDLRLFLRQKSSYIWLFLVPLAFVYFIGLANRGPGDPSNRTPPVLVTSADTNFVGRIFCEVLGAQGLWVLKPHEADRAVAEIRVPADLTSRLLRGEQTRLSFVKRPDSSEGDAAIIELRLARALIALNSYVLEAVSRTNSTATITEERLRQLVTASNPVRLDAKFAGRKPVPSGFSFSLPAMLIMYLTMNQLIFGGATIAGERRNGVIRRIMSSPVTRIELVQGKIYGLVLLGAVQIAFFLAVGKLLFHVNLGANLPGVIVVLLVFSWVSSSLGVLVGSLTVSEDRIIGICVLASLLMAALGGCWWPMEIAPPFQKTIALCLPTGWVSLALHQLISFGSSFEAAMLPLFVLLLFGTGSNWLAARFFKA